MIENAAEMGPRLRPGRKNPRNLYLQIGAEPSDERDLPIGFFIDTDVAELIADGLNSAWHLNEIRLSAQGRGDEPRLDTQGDESGHDPRASTRTER